MRGLLTQLRGLRAQLREDFSTHQGKLLSPGFHAVAVHRLAEWSRHMPVPARLLFAVVHRLLYTLVRNVYGVDLPRQAAVGRRVWIAHHQGVVVSQSAVIGDGVMIRQNVTIGRFDRGRKRKPPYAPRVENDVEIGAGAVLLGGITVGKGARIGPNAVVTTDVPAHGSAFASPTAVMPPLQLDDAGADGERTVDDQENARGT